MYESIRYDVRDQIATIALDRPEKLNAYTPEMGKEVVAAFRRARNDVNVRVVILTGEGRAFCAGVDLDCFRAHMSGETPRSGPTLGEEAFVRTFPLELVDYPKPVIAAINGAAYGVGVTMTLGCDVRIAARGAKFGLNFTELGVLQGLGSTHHLPHLIGLPRALELVLSGAILSADEAARIGLVQKTVPDAALRNAARQLAASIAEARPEILTAASLALRRGVASCLIEAMRTERAQSRALREKGNP